VVFLTPTAANAEMAAIFHVQPPHLPMLTSKSVLTTWSKTLAQLLSSLLITKLSETKSCMKYEYGLPGCNTV
jgi:hypothetical protein